MLVIREGQLGVFARDNLSRFEESMVRHLETCFPRRYAAMGRENAADLVRRTLGTAMENGIRARAAVTVLLELVLQYGEQFELAPDPAWALSILRHPALPGHLKVDTIRDRFDHLLQGRQIVPLQTD